MKGQGSLEYLIITAAVLAIAAVVVLFLTGAFSSAGKGGSVSLCKQEAAACAAKKGTTTNYNCTTTCVAQCADVTGKDVLNIAVAPSTAGNCLDDPLTGWKGNDSTKPIALPVAWGCSQCARGNVSGI